MNRALKIGVAIVVGAIAAGAALIYPYEVPSMPEWKLQVLDSSGKPVAGVRVNQEWVDPIDDGIIRADGKQTDASGTVVFPKRILHNRLALHFGKMKQSTRAFLCPGDQYGAVYWDGVGELPATLTLQQGACPYD